MAEKEQPFKTEKLDGRRRKVLASLMKIKTRRVYKLKIEHPIARQAEDKGEDFYQVWEAAF